MLRFGMKLILEFFAIGIVPEEFQSKTYDTEELEKRMFFEVELEKTEAYFGRNSLTE